MAKLDDWSGLEALAARLYGDAPVPTVGVVRQRVEAPRASDVEAEAEAETARVLRESGRPPGPVAIGVGSRGIRDLAALVRGAVRAFRDAGWSPFIVPAMGSHGAATAEGQARVLAGYGISEAELGVPVRATMETVVLAEVDGLPYHVDRFAAEAGALFLVCRIKPHTDFAGPWESGPSKMAGIGIGKLAGARVMHSRGVPGLRETVPRAARTAVERGLLVGALAVVENQRDESALVAGLGGSDIAGRREAELLQRAYELMPRIPFDRLDVLVVERMGKDVSGTGMDSNVLNRMRIHGEPEPEGLWTAVVVVLDLTEASHGNGLGTGLADFMPRRLFEKLDLAAVYTNGLTAGLVGLERCQVPMLLPTDRDCVLAAIACRGRPSGEPLRLAWIRDTLHTETIAVSDALFEEATGRPDLEAVAEPRPMPFDAGGSLRPLDELLHH